MSTVALSLLQLAPLAVPAPPIISSYALETEVAVDSGLVEPTVPCIAGGISVTVAAKGAGLSGVVRRRRMRVFETSREREVRVALGDRERAYSKRGAATSAVHPMLHSGACAGACGTATSQWAVSLQHMR
jgi:hypothetical protein